MVHHTSKTSLDVAANNSPVLPPPPSQTFTQPPQSPLHNFVVDSADKSVQTILNKLCLLSKLQEGEKIDVTTMCLQDDTWWTRLLRTIGGGEQNRNSTLEFIKRLTDDALDVIERCFASPQQIHIKLGEEILRKLTDAIKGINNLYVTYKDDRYFISRLETQLLILNVKISRWPVPPGRDE